tara:strand:+ start:1178 stop:1321 length:144 start_codon:yes stop_codon:yes gene_type:complete
MENYEITSINRGLDYTEYVKGKNILDALGNFYSAFGYQKILSIKLTE